MAGLPQARATNCVAHLCQLEEFQVEIVAQERQVASAPSWWLAGAGESCKVGVGAFVPAAVIAVSCGWGAEIQRIPVRSALQDASPACSTTSKSALYILIGCMFVTREWSKATYLLLRYILGYLAERTTITVLGACP
jgi:hypothetical protein